MWGIVQTAPKQHSQLGQQLSLVQQITLPVPAIAYLQCSVCHCAIRDSTLYDYAWMVVVGLLIDDFAMGVYATRQRRGMKMIGTMTESFGSQLSKYRQRADLAQNALARLTGINVGTINRLERDQRLPASRQQVLALVRVLDLTMAETNRMLDAAGLPAEGFGPAVTSNPTICKLVDLLQDDAIPAADHEELLTMVQHYVNLVARANGRTIGDWE